MHSVTYLDFELKIAQGKGRRYSVSVLRSPAGEASGTFEFPFTARELERFKTTIELAMLRSRRDTRRPLSPAVRELVGFGVKLFDAIFNNSVKACYDGSLRLAMGQGRGLRIKLRIEPPELLTLPWEFLYNSEERKFLILSTRTPLVRYTELLHPPMPLAVQYPVRILVVISNPDDYILLDADSERRRLDDALDKLVATGLVEIHFLESPTLRCLQNKLRETSYHILHFIGHGGYDEVHNEGYLILEDERGHGLRVNGANLGRLLSDHVTLRLAVLNACEGARTSATDIGPYDQFPGVAQALVHAGMQAVVAMQFEISDEAAVTFAQEFYAAIVDGYPVDAAVAEGRKAIDLSLQDTVEWGTPVLYMRAPDGVIFQMPQQAVEAQLEEELAALYQAALAAMAGRRWADASALLQRIIAHDADYRDAMTRLGEAQRELAQEVNGVGAGRSLKMNLAHLRETFARLQQWVLSSLSSRHPVVLSPRFTSSGASLGIVAVLLALTVYLASATVEKGAFGIGSDGAQVLTPPPTQTSLGVPNMAEIATPTSMSLKPTVTIPPTPTASPSATRPASPTALPTASATVTASPTASPSSTATATASATATAMPSPTLTASATATPTVPTATPTRRPSSTPTPGPTVPTATPTATRQPPTATPKPPPPPPPTATPVPPTPTTMRQLRNTPTSTPVPPQRVTPTPTPDT